MKEKSTNASKDSRFRKPTLEHVTGPGRYEKGNEFGSDHGSFSFEQSRRGFALCGAVFNSVVSLIPLILRGVDVDSCIITVNHLSFERTGTIEQRFGRAMRDAGPTCFITTPTTATRMLLT